MNSNMLSPLATTLLISTSTLVLVGYREPLKVLLNKCLSHIIHRYLIWRHSLRAIDDGRTIPTCPYEWPNGQGDVAKFLEGEVNSKKWGETHGRVYRIWSGMHPEIVVRDPIDVQTVFKDSDQHTKAVNNDAGWLMGELLGQCVGLISGPDYHRVKSATASHFAYKLVHARHLAPISSITEQHLAELSSSERLAKGTLNPVADLKFLPFWITAEILYGKGLTSSARAELRQLSELRDTIWSRMMQGGLTRFAWSRHLPTKTTQNLREFKARWATLNDGMYEQCLQEENCDGHGDSSPIVAMYGQMRQGTVSKEQLLQTLDEMLFANLDVTMGGISWNLVFLAANKDVQHQVRQEVLHASSSAAAHDWQSYLSSSSSLLAACILESARLKPLAAFSVPQSAPTDRIVSGFRVPAGTNYIVDTHALNVENMYWGADGDAYRPSRFLGKKPAEMRYQFWRFGFGPRQCMGKFVVELMMRVLIAYLVRDYELDVTEATQWDKNPTTWIMHPDTELSYKKVGA